jgi:hypothetical protein
VSSFTTPGAPVPRGVAASLADEVGEGLRLCEFVVRMRTKNRILVDTLTRTVGAAEVAGWRAFVREDARRLARESRDTAKRAAGLRDATAGADGVGRSAHDYRGLDAHHLDRRAQVAKLISRRLLAASGSTPFLAEMLRAAGEAAAEEVLTGTAATLPPGDRALLEARMDAMRSLITAEETRGGGRRLRFLRR